jgi:uncharacterized protein
MKFFGTFSQKVKQLFGTTHSPKSAPEEDWLVKKFRSDAEKGDADSQNSLGMLYANGINVQQDFKKALHWFRKSADQGYSLGQCNLGLMYLDGYGVEKDNEEAAKFIRAAAEKGVAIAQLKIGEMYYDGNGVPRDYAKAKKWFKSAALQGNEDAINAKEFGSSICN